MYIAVIGAGQCDSKIEKIAYQVGKLIAENKAILICGGLGGVMDAAASGAKDGDGITVGILPGETRVGSSSSLDIAIPTGIGEARNAIITRAADAVIAVCGEYGTLSEIGLALKMGKPVIGLDTWQLLRNDAYDTGMIRAKSPKEAVDLAIESART